MEGGGGYAVEALVRSGVGALDLTTLSLATSGDTALDTRLFTEDESDAGPLITTKWVGTIIIFR